MLDLRPRSHDTAELVVSGGVRGRVGIDDSPVAIRCGDRFVLEQPLAPDEGWRLTLGRGAFAADEAADDDVVRAYDAWARGSAAERRAEALSLLPDGRYLLVRRSEPFVRTARLELGNELVAMPPNAARVLERPGVTIACFGARHDAPPDRTAPLVGVVVLGWNGATESLAAIFFEPTHPVGAHEGRTLDAVLVLPMTGTLVVDALTGFRSEAESRRVRSAWELSGAPAMASSLASSIAK